ncbi:MAG TPA: GNAT family N-acetyltransferase, partial [Burkholderiales bacterium]|nr:GNAT family N-acetyltransferase [Burkholderiales bacterium]
GRPGGTAAQRRRPGGTGTIVEVRSGRAALSALIPEWEALADEAAEPNPFYEHWMLLPALEAYAAEDEARCVAVWQDGKLEALFPMRLERRFRGLPVPALRSWYHRNMLVCAPLVRQNSAAASVGALLASGLAPVMEFLWIPTGGVFYGALAEAATHARLPWMVSDAYTRPVILHSRDPRARFNSNMRNNLRRWQARLAEAGKLAPVRLAPGDDVAAWTEGFMRLEASGWKGKRGSALACREDDRRFVAAVFPEAFRRGRLQITGLDLDGRPLARHCMIAHGEGAYCFKIAYDEAYARCSPGVLGEVENVRQFLEAPGPRWLDSNTSHEHAPGFARVWKDRRTMHCVAVGARGVGKPAVAALPLLRFAKQLLKKT